MSVIARRSDLVALVTSGALCSALFGLPASAEAQAKVSPDWYCNYDGGALIDDIYWFPADLETEKRAREIFKAIGLAPTVILRAANVPTAMAAISGTERVIYYNQELIRRASMDTEERWIVRGVLAHEVGHHANGHLTQLEHGAARLKSGPEIELEADQFAGGALYRLGANDAQAQLAVNRLTQIFSTPTHPGRSARAAATISGWTLAVEAVRSINEVNAKRVLLIDSFMRRYDQSSQLPNSQYIRTLIMQLSAAEQLQITAEQLLVTKNFQDHDYVLSLHPHVIVIHLSSFFASENKTIDPNEFARANEEFRTFVSYVFKRDPTMRVLAYTRAPPQTGPWDAKTRSTVMDSVKKQDVFLKQYGERARLVYLPWTARFDQPNVALTMKTELRAILQVR